jgi:REJ domain
LSAPVQFQRSRAFSIVSDIELKCSTSLATNMTWRIKKCNTSSCYSPIQLSQPVSTTVSELFIPAQTLDYGTYELQLTVTMITAPTLTTSATIYVQITAANIQANLLQFGTSMIRQGYRQNLTLDPGKFSIDPDATTFNASVSWTFLHPISHLFHSSIDRIGSTPTSVDWMASTISHLSMEHNCLSMILGLIL